MVWSICTTDLTRIGSFNEAKAHWEATKEWKNEYTDRRQLAGRRKTTMYLRRLSEGRGYECVLYNTAIVTYMADGCVKLDSYSTTSTVAFAWYVAPPGCKPLSHKGAMYWCVQTPDGEHYQTGTLLLKPAAKPNCWDIISKKIPSTEPFLDRKKAAEVRKALAPYSKWHKITEVMDPRRIIPGQHYLNRGLLQKLLTTPDDHRLFPQVREALGDPSRFREDAYVLAGARTTVPVPFDRLPKN